MFGCCVCQLSLSEHNNFNKDGLEPAVTLPETCTEYNNDVNIIIVQCLYMKQRHAYHHHGSCDIHFVPRRDSKPLFWHLPRNWIGQYT